MIGGIDGTLAASGYLGKPLPARGCGQDFRMPRQAVPPTPLTELFRANLHKLMRADRELRSQSAVAAASKVGQRSVSRILRGEQSPTLDMVHRIAGAFTLEPWQMLVPEFEPDNPPITKQIDERQQELLKRFRVAAQELAHYEVDTAPRSRSKSRD